MDNKDRINLWNAINEYVYACGGDPSKNVFGNVRRQHAVVNVEQIFTKLLGASMSDIDDDACPGCGCLPGDGLTDNCDDVDGCGYFRDMHGERTCFENH